MVAWGNPGFPHGPPPFAAFRWVGCFFASRPAEPASGERQLPGGPTLGFFGLRARRAAPGAPATDASAGDFASRRPGCARSARCDPGRPKATGRILSWAS